MVQAVYRALQHSAFLGEMYRIVTRSLHALQNRQLVPDRLILKLGQSVNTSAWSNSTERTCTCNRINLTPWLRDRLVQHAVHPLRQT